jgi:hypothetical protein
MSSDIRRSPLPGDAADNDVVGPADGTQRLPGLPALLGTQLGRTEA